MDHAGGIEPELVAVALQTVVLRTPVVGRRRTAGSSRAALAVIGEANNVFHRRHLTAGALDASVRLIACQNTMQNNKLTREDMYSGIAYVQAGVTHIMKRQREGWAYIRP